MFISSNCVCSRSFLSSAASGSSSSRIFGDRAKRTRQRHPLLLTAGELAGLALGKGFELDELQHPVGPVLDL